VGREAALDIVARHLLAAADDAQAALAQIALAAGQHRRHDHRDAHPVLGTGAGSDDAAADLVAERERQRLVGAHAVVVVAEIGVADAATGDLHHHLADARLDVEIDTLERCLRCRHLPTMSLDSHGVWFRLGCCLEWLQNRTLW